MRFDLLSNVDLERVFEREHARASLRTRIGSWPLPVARIQHVLLKEICEFVEVESTASIRINGVELCNNGLKLYEKDSRSNLGEKPLSHELGRE